MVIRVYSKYKTKPPQDALADGEERIIGYDKLYPEMLGLLDRCQVNSVTTRTNDFMALHLIDLGDLRKFAMEALRYGTYINSQWCRGNAPHGLYACDSYSFRYNLYSRKEKVHVPTTMYIKLCLTDTNHTIAVISLHDSTKTKVQS